MTEYTSLTSSQWASLIASAVSAVKGAPSLGPGSVKHAPANLTPKQLARTIDHTLLKLDATEEQIVTLCQEARTWGFRTVCVRLPFVSLARQQLRGTDVGVTCVVGFHEGTYTREEKIREAQAALKAGATEIDVVLNHTLFSRQPQTQQHPYHKAPPATPDYAAIFAELAGLRALASLSNTTEAEIEAVTFKLILETAALHEYADLAEASGGNGAQGAEEMIIAATVLAWHAGFDFVKTSTGFYVSGSTPGRPTGATTSDVSLMWKACLVLFEQGRTAASGQGTRSSPMKVKASGGIRTLADARAMLETGAERLGVSAGVGICEEARHESGNGGGEDGAEGGGQGEGGGRGGDDGY